MTRLTIFLQFYCQKDDITWHSKLFSEFESVVLQVLLCLFCLCLFLPPGFEFWQRVRDHWKMVHSGFQGVEHHSKMEKGCPTDKGLSQGSVSLVSVHSPTSNLYVNLGISLSLLLFVCKTIKIMFPYFLQGQHDVNVVFS